MLPAIDSDDRIFLRHRRTRMAGLRNRFKRSCVVLLQQRQMHPPERVLAEARESKAERLRPPAGHLIVCAVPRFDGLPISIL